jgi:hypothetical protein
MAANYKMDVRGDTTTYGLNNENLIMQSMLGHVKKDLLQKRKTIKSLKSRPLEIKTKTGVQ